MLSKGKQSVTELATHSTALHIPLPNSLMRCRKNKSNLLELELPKLEKLVRKGKTTPELISDREKKVWNGLNGLTGHRNAYGCRAPMFAASICVNPSLGCRLLSAKMPSLG